MDIIDKLWGKSNPYKSLLHHMMDAGACAYALVSTGCARNNLLFIASSLKLDQDDCLDLICYLAMLHDIGKAHPDFQRNADLPQVEEMYEQKWICGIPKSTKFRHEKYSAKVLKRIWTEKQMFSEEWTVALCKVIELHHQGKTGDGYLPSNAYGTKWTKAQDEIENIIANLSRPPKIEGTCTNWDAVCTEIMGIIILSDWIASSKLFDNLEASTDLLYFNLAKQKANEAIKTYQLEFIDYSENLKGGFNKMWPQIADSSMRPIQKLCEKEGSNPASFYIIEAPMGEGKTEAALYLASKMMIKYHKSGLYVALPTSATSNQMHERVNDLFKHLEIPQSRLLHSTAWATENIETVQNTTAEDENALSEWLAPVRRGLLSANAVGTVDQAMMAVLLIKYGVLRLIGLSNKVLIIDEIHAYDAYMTDIIEHLLMWCKALNIPVILLSATLTKGKRDLFLKAYSANLNYTISMDYPLITKIMDANVDQIKTNSYIQRNYRFTTKPYLNDHDATVNLLLDMISSGGCICFMVDTVKEAQQYYLQLKDKISKDTKLMLFHSRYLVKRRAEIEKDCLNMFGKSSASRPQKAILVCTQVVEQSLDLDFDSMITQIAPIDLLLQRAGRVHRHERVSRPERYTKPTIVVLTSNDGKFEHTPASYVYAPFLLEKTHEYLGDERTIKMPNDMRDAIEFVYSATPDNTQMEEYATMVFDNQMKTQHARGGELPGPNNDYFYATQSMPDAQEWLEDESDYIAEHPKTRDGKGTIRIAILDRKQMEKEELSPYDKNIAREILLQSVALRLTKQEKSYVEGKGVLKGCVLLQKDDTGAADYNNQIISNDDEIGVTVKRR